MEIVTTAGDVSGHRFAVQLKATAATMWRTFEIEPATAGYYSRLALPLVLVRHRSVDDSLLIRWSHDRHLPQMYVRLQQSITTSNPARRQPTRGDMSSIAFGQAVAVA